MDRGRLHTLVIVAATLMVSTGLAVVASAHPEGPAHHAPHPPHATEVMNAFAADTQSAAVGEPVKGPVTCSSGSAAGYPCSNVDLLSYLPLSHIGGTRSNSAANDIWGWTYQNPNTGAVEEYAIIGRVFGTSFVNITKPENPIYLGELPTHGSFGSSWRDIKVYNNHAFIVSEALNHGMQVFDLTQLSAVTSETTFTETAHYNGNASAHNIAINEDTGFAYIVGASGKNSCNSGLHMVNIQNPTSPSFAGCYGGDGYTHDVQCVVYSGPDTVHQGKEICFASNEDTVTIVDVTDKSNPVMLSRTPYPGAQYTHQGWLTGDQTHFLLDDELDEQNNKHNTRTRVFDVRDLENPQVVHEFTSSVAAIDHNQYVKGNYSFQANYRAGLRILDISNLSSLSEVGFFDVYPADDAAEFNGAWSNYPYFASGVVIVSGIEQGLFVLKPTNLTDSGGGDSPPSVSITNPTDGATVSGPVTITADASDDSGVTQVEFFIDGVSVRLDDGTDGDGIWSADWDTTGYSEGQHTVTATATDTIGQTASHAITVTVDNLADPTIHVGDLDGSTGAGKGGRWDATVTITVHASGEGTVGGATVEGSWDVGGAASCTTGGDGTCLVTLSGIHRNTGSVTFTVTNLAASGYAYDSTQNHDPDSDSDGTTITLTKS